MITVHSRWSSEKHCQEWVVYQGSEPLVICPTEIDAQYNAQLIRRARDAWEAFNS